MKKSNTQFFAYVAFVSVFLLSNAQASNSFAGDEDDFGSLQRNASFEPSTPKKSSLKRIRNVNGEPNSDEENLQIQENSIPVTPGAPVKKQAIRHAWDPTDPWQEDRIADSSARYQARMDMADDDTSE